MRKLATIQKIKKLESIEGADRIEKATVLGWECVVKKDEFKVNDLCVFFEVDSKLPKHSVFDFMSKRKFLVKTARFRKQIAQGLALPLEILDNFGENLSHKVKEGDDVTKKIGVVKYDPEKKVEKSSVSFRKPKNKHVVYMMKYKWFRKVYSTLYPKLKGNFPTFIPKTDEERVQNTPYVATKHDGKEFYYAEKLDGQSFTAFYNSNLTPWYMPWLKDAFGVCSRNLWLKNANTSTWWRITKKYGINKRLADYCKTFGVSLAIQGEIIGEGIQENKYGIKGIELYCFSVYDINKKKYLNRKDKLLVFKTLCLKYVPDFETFTMDKDVHNVEWFVKQASMLSTLREVKAEGLVFRCVDDDKISFKVINSEFLLEHKI